jgi:hypothetical protein
MVVRIIQVLLYCTFAYTLPLAAESLGQTTSIPKLDARESEWSDYVARIWNTRFQGKLKAETEFILPDESRVDIKTADSSGVGERTIVWETERAEKWKESIGQAAFYHAMSGADGAGVVLITLNDEKDKIFILRCAITCRRCGLYLFTVDENGVIRKCGTNERISRLILPVSQ